ncbi:MAG: PDZ domain-containing protein [Gemmatimonadota bacterium]|nr:PDZ domain-containing protein [Gemmatimonadota bacterium]
MSRKWKAEGGRARRAGAALWVAALLVAVAAVPALEAQERDRGRDWRGFDRPLMRLQGNAMSRALLGIRLSTRPADADAEGAEVHGVTEDGPADQAGIREGDIITTLDGQSLLEPLADAELEERVDADRSVPSQRLLLLARGLEPGEEVVVAYVRDGQTAEVAVEPQVAWMGRRFDADRVREVIERAREAAERMRIPAVGRGAPHGISLATLNPELGRYFGAESGALVTAADEDNPLGLEAGDVILSIDGRAVDSAGDARRILRSYEEGEEMTLTILRERAEMQVSGAVEDRVRPRRRGARR